ncbi:hypothetical protein IJG04_01000 [Candidatus Saccharibacteria bacterium]|nr:hypothetical protein [Candidatus Saccharibacteria bacterium]
MKTSIIDIELGKSSSPNYQKAKTYLLSIQSSFEEGETTKIRIDDIAEYIENQVSIMRFIKIAEKWKQVSIMLNGKKLQCVGDFYYFAESLKAQYPEFAKVIRNQIDDIFVAMGDINYEKQLPMPYVHYPDLYGAFIAFSETINSQIYFCECQRSVIEKVIKSRYNFDNNADEWTNTHRMDGFPPELAAIIPNWHNDGIISRIHFAKGICFKCNNIIPMLDWCHPMYGGVFKRRYGWYIAEKTKRCYLKFNQKDSIDSDDDPEIYDGIRRIKLIIKKMSSLDSIRNPEEYHKCFQQYEKAKRQLNNNIENAVREEFGYRKIGDAWISETILSEIIKNLYPKSEIKRHYRPNWLEKLELDIYLPQEKLTFEYQGIQHFKAVEHWGGEKKLKEQQEHDGRKARICAERGIKLIHINYDEPLSEEYVKTKIK